MIVESCLVFTHDATCVTHSRVLGNGCPHAIYVHNSQQHINGPNTLYSHVINAHNSVYPINGSDSALGRELWNRHIVIMYTFENQWFTGVHFKGPCIEKSRIGHLRHKLRAVEREAGTMSVTKMSIYGT